MGSKTIRSSKHELDDTLNSHFWSADIIMQPSPVGLQNSKKVRSGMKWIFSDCPVPARTPAHSSFWVWELAEALEAGRGWMEPRRGTFPQADTKGKSERSRGVFLLCSRPLILWARTWRWYLLVADHKPSPTLRHSGLPPATLSVIILPES